MGRQGCDTGSYKVVPSVYTPGQTDVGHGPPHPLPPLQVTLRLPSTPFQQGELLPLLSNAQAQLGALQGPAPNPPPPHKIPATQLSGAQEEGRYNHTPQSVSPTLMSQP